MAGGGWGYFQVDVPNMWPYWWVVTWRLFKASMAIGLLILVIVGIAQTWRW